MENEGIRKWGTGYKKSTNGGINFVKGASRTGSVSHTGRLIGKLENERISKYRGLRGSEENRIFQKEVEGNFGEKRLLGGWG